MMRNIAVMLLLSALALLAPVHSANAQSRGRYTAVTNAIFSQAEYNGDPSMLDGYAKSTAGEAGLAGKEVYNEYPAGPKVVVLTASAVVYYDAASKEPMYLEGCRKGGKPWYNRLKLVERVVTIEKIVEKPVVQIVEKPVPVEVKIPCPTCPVDGVAIDTYATKTAKFFGGLWQTVASVGVGVLSSGAFSDSGQRGRAMWQSALVSGLSARTAQFFNPSDNRARILVSANGSNQTYELKKGQSIQGLPGGGSADWHGDSITVTIPLCGVWSASPHTGFNFTPVPIVRQNVFVDRVVENPTHPIKTNPGPPGPGIPGTTGPKSSDSRRISAAWQ